MKLSSSQSISLLIGIQLAATTVHLVAEPTSHASSLQSKLIERCCEVGRERAIESPRFDCKMSTREALINSPATTSTTGNSRSIIALSAESLLARDSTFADQCEMVLESCCMGHHRTRNCDSGKQFAKSGAACMDVELSKEATVATESFNDCCMSCSLGILAAKNPGQNETSSSLAQLTRAQLNNRCKLMTHLASSLSGQMYEQAYTECCQENLPRLSGALTEPGSPIDCNQSNPCSQRCVTSSLVELPAGSSIQSQRMRLEQATAHRCDCFAGYKLAPDGISCLDVDECKLQQHTCDPQSEVCDNTRGGFRCLARRSSVDSSANYNNNYQNTNDQQVAGDGFVSMRLCPLGKRWSVRDNQCLPNSHNQHNNQHYSSSSSSYLSSARSSAYRSLDG